MGEDNQFQKDLQWLKRRLDEIYGTTNDEEALNRVPDTGLGPEDQAHNNLTEERKLHELLTLWFNVDGLTSVRQQHQAIFQRPLQVFLGMLQGETAEQIADKLKCDLATVYRHRKNIRFVLWVFDAFIFDLETRLKHQVKERLIDQVTIDVFQKIRIGWDRKKIIRHLEEKDEVIDRAYITLRRESMKMWKEFQDQSKRDPGSFIIRLIEAQRRSKS